MAQYFVGAIYALTNPWPRLDPCRISVLELSQKLHFIWNSDKTKHLPSFSHHQMPMFLERDLLSSAASTTSPWSGECCVWQCKTGIFASWVRTHGWANDIIILSLQRRLAACATDSCMSGLVIFANFPSKDSIRGQPGTRRKTRAQTSAKCVGKKWCFVLFESRIQ
jgi:hypothetical protein